MNDFFLQYWGWEFHKIVLLEFELLWVSDLTLLQNFTLRWSKQKFCEINFFTKLISRIIFQMKVKFRFFYTVVHDHIQICHKYFFLLKWHLYLHLDNFSHTADNFIAIFFFTTALIFVKPLWINQHLQKIWDKLSLVNESGPLLMKSIFSKMQESAKLCVPKNMILARKKMLSNWISWKKAWAWITNITGSSITCR